MSRRYEGLWSVLIVWDEGTGETFGHTEPDAYEEAEKLCLLLGMGVPYEGHRAKRALLVPQSSVRDGLSGRMAYERWRSQREGETANRVIPADDAWTVPPAQGGTKPTEPGPGHRYEGWA